MYRAWQGGKGVPKREEQINNHLYTGIVITAILVNSVHPLKKYMENL